MTFFDYDDMAETADEMIQEFGATGSIIRITPGNGPSYNPGNPTETPHPARLVITAFKANEVDGTRIRATDKKAIVSAVGLAVAPRVDDALLDADGERLKIVEVMPLRPAQTTVIYTCVVRK